MTHLTAGELRAWFEDGNITDRERVIGHLAECGECRRALSALAAASELPAAGSPPLTAAEAVRRGYDARKAHSRSEWAAWLRPLYAVAGVAVIVLAVLWLGSPGRVQPDDAIRASELLALGPTGTTRTLEFRWESPFEAARYRLTVRDAKGVVVHSADAPSSPIALDQPLRTVLTAGESYTWQVAALDAAGDTIAESKPAVFRYAR